MPKDESLADAVGKLRGILGWAQRDPEFGSIVAARDEVLARFGPVFCLDHAPHITEANVKAFLRSENNKHWSGLHRQGNRICADMDRLRATLAAVLDEARPLVQRLDEAISAVPGMGKAILTAILLVAYPDRYGVWNNTSEAALRQLGIWPEFDRGSSFGQRYEQVNGILRTLAGQLSLDLWTLDGLSWAVLRGPIGEIDITGGESSIVDAGPAFGLERHLHEFLRDNWDKIDLGRDYVLYATAEDSEAGYEFPTEVGRIDLLARHKQRESWLVVELKRGQSDDATVGQVLRYIGWVRRHLAKAGEEVRGMIIAREARPGLLYAVDATRDVELRLYEVSFRLKAAPKLDGAIGDV
jgi:hypothetical protein